MLEGSHANEDTHAGSGNALVTPANTSNVVSAHSTSDALHWKLRMQERRIEALERKLAAEDDSRMAAKYGDFAPDEPIVEEEMMFRGKGFKTQFHGVTSVMSIIARVRSSWRRNTTVYADLFP